MTTDFRALITRMAKELDEYRQLLLDDRTVTHRLSDEARAALAKADEPAVPEGREPAAVTGQHRPMDEDWDALVNRLWSKYETIGYQGERFMYEGDFCTALDLVRQEIARWGTPNLTQVRSSLGDGAEEPAVSEGGEPTRDELWGLWLRLDQEMPDRPAAVAEFWEHARVHTLARWSNRQGLPDGSPPADGEVAELVAWLREQLHVCLQAPWTPGIKHFGRAAELLQRQALVPVAVSERLPAMVTDGLRVAGDCDEQGRCWAGTRASMDTSGDRDIDLPPS